MSIEQREITKEYFSTLATRRNILLDQARVAESRYEFMDTFEHILRINRLQLELIPQIYPKREGPISQRPPNYSVSPSFPSPSGVGSVVGSSTG